MNYRSFKIENYRAVENPVIVKLSKKTLLPLVGINECGKTTILQAIFCFDYINDNEYGGQHLKNTLNLYKTQDKDPLITAEIDIKLSKLESYWELLSSDKKLTNSSGEVPDSFPIKNTNYKGYVTIQRNLETKKYTIIEIDELTLESEDLFARTIIKYMPYILYNDDFQDRPPDSIPIPLAKPKNLSGWIAIYERLFRYTNDNYSLFSIITEQDKRRKDSIVSDVQEEINKTLSKAWKTFLLDKQKSISVRLDFISDNTNTRLDVHIVEKLGTRDRFFKVVDRSKGFLWFFNFVMKLEFNPKSNGIKSNTIYLLDEPGSYLHSMAQEKLCSKLKTISEKYGHIIYCTHSHHLLNPNYIPVNKILIVNKSPKKKITLTPLPLVDTKTEKINALQPVFEALHISSFDFYNNKNPIIAVEGIYDKYAIELFIDIGKAYNVLPGTSADSIIKNIQFLNAYGKNYIAIWDNDDEGQKNYKRACSLFGEYESKKFDLLPSKNGKKRRMEAMFSKSDLLYIKNEFNLPARSSYESIILELYYSNSGKKKKILQSISSKTRNNFDILRRIIQKRFEVVNKLEEERS